MKTLNPHHILNRDVFSICRPAHHIVRLRHPQQAQSLPFTATPHRHARQKTRRRSDRRISIHTIPPPPTTSFSLLRLLRFLSAHSLFPCASKPGAFGVQPLPRSPTLDNPPRRAASPLCTDPPARAGIRAPLQFHACCDGGIALGDW